MSKISLHAQAAAVDVARVQASRRGCPSLKPKEWEMLEPRLRAAHHAMLMIEVFRDRLPAEFIAECEGGK